MRPRLSIITPSLDQGQFIEATLRSILDQEFDGLELLVVDGGSTDGTLDIIRRYEDRLAWWVSEPDAGQTDALNKGLARATGEVIAYLNSDDLYLPGSLEAAYSALTASDASWVSGSCRFVDEDHRTYDVWHPQPPPPRRHAWIVNPWAVPQPSSFWRREVFDRHGAFRTDMHYVFDVEFMLRLAFAGEPPLLLDRELAVRVVHGESKSAVQANFDRERALLLSTFRPELTPYERLQLVLGRAAIRAGLYRGGGRPADPVS